MQKMQWLACVISLSFLAGCGGRHGSDRERSEMPEQHESQSLALDKSERVRVELKMAAGEMDVRGGAEKLMQADFRYNVPSWKPELRYTAGGTVGDLVLEQRGVKTSGGDGKNRWDLQFNDSVPMDFRVGVGAGEVRMKLGSLSLRSLDMDMGAGTLQLDLRGTPKHDYEAHIRGGVGEATVYLPKDVGVAATATGGLGDISVSGLKKVGDRYVNDAFDRAGVKIRLEIQGGVGSIRLIGD